MHSLTTTATATSTTTDRTNGLTALAAGLTLGTAPMLWSSVFMFGSLDVRPAHLAGALTLALVLLPRSGARLRPQAVIGLGVIGTLTVLGAAINSFVHVNAFWPTSEMLRFIANLAIALAVVSAMPLDDARNARRMGWATCAGLAWGLSAWLHSIETTPFGLQGAVSATFQGRANQLLYEIQLPAMRSLYHAEVLLGTRHGVIFGFLVGSAVLHMLTEIADDRRLRLATRVVSLVILAATVLSSSRSAFAMLAVVGVVYTVSRRADFVRLGRTYVVAAGGCVLAGTTVASGLLARFTRDTDSFESRQGDLSTVLEGDWSLAGLDKLPPGVNPPHNSFVEMAAGGGALALLGSLIVVFIAGYALWPRSSTSLTTFLLASAVLLRTVTAARGSLDTTALLAFSVLLVTSPIPYSLASRARAIPSASLATRPLALPSGGRS